MTMTNRSSLSHMNVDEYKTQCPIRVTANISSGKAMTWRVHNKQTKVTQW